MQISDCIEISEQQYEELGELWHEVSKNKKEDSSQGEETTSHG